MGGSVGVLILIFLYVYYGVKEKREKLYWYELIICGIK